MHPPSLTICALSHTLTHMLPWLCQSFPYIYFFLSCPFIFYPCFGSLQHGWWRVGWRWSCLVYVLYHWGLKHTAKPGGLQLRQPWRSQVRSVSALYFFFDLFRKSFEDSIWVQRADLVLLVQLLAGLRLLIRPHSQDHRCFGGVQIDPVPLLWCQSRPVYHAGSASVQPCAKLVFRVHGSHPSVDQQPHHVSIGFS